MTNEMHTTANRLQRSTIQVIVALACALLMVFSMGSEAYAQSCRSVQNTVRSIERDREFRNLNQNTQTAQTLARDLGRLERAFVQAGCQQALNAGQRLSRDCQNAARQITRGRSNLQTLEQMINNGRALAQQRAALIEQLNAGVCNSSATTQTRQPNIFEQIFDALGGNGFGAGDIIEDPWSNYYGNTVRSVCVRVSDGYYWPMSYSTVPDYLGRDLQQCQAMCPNTEVDLYYYSNPGQEPRDMVNLNGTPYTSLATAFSYRNAYDVSLKCNTQTTIARIDVVDFGGETRPIMTVGEISVPLPIRDPRRQVETTILAAVDFTPPVPLPRKRPNLEAGETQVRAVVVQTADMTTLEVGGKTVRLVGAETPYIQLAEANS